MSAHTRVRDRSRVRARAGAHRREASFELLAGALADPLAQHHRSARVQPLDLVEQPRALAGRRALRDQQRRRARRTPCWRGVEVPSLLSTRLAADSASMRSGLARAPLAPTRTLDLEHQAPLALQVLAQPGAPTAGALDPEHELLTVAGG